MNPPDSRKALKKILARLFPSASCKTHRRGVLMARKGLPDQLVVCDQGNVRPFHLEVVRETWDALWDAAGKAGAELSFAIPDGSGTSLTLLPLSAADRIKPGWPVAVESKVYDEELDEWLPCEVYRVPLAIGKRAEVPEHRWTEAELQAACVTWFRETYPERLLFSVPVEATVKQYGKYLKTGVLAGTADCVALLPDGQTMLVEFKTRNGTLRESQEEFQRKSLALGHRYVVVRSVAKFRALFA